MLNTKVGNYDQNLLLLDNIFKSKQTKWSERKYKHLKNKQIFNG